MYTFCNVKTLHKTANLIENGQLNLFFYLVYDLAVAI